MIHDVVSAQYRGEYRIELAFDDGKTGIVDFAKYLAKGGVFHRFSDLDFFKQFSVNSELGVLTWGDQIDVAPETLYAEATKTPLPDWMAGNVADDVGEGGLPDARSVELDEAVVEPRLFDRTHQYQPASSGPRRASPRGPRVARSRKPASAARGGKKTAK
jgi:hypothetical protein